MFCIVADRKVDTMICTKINENTRTFLVLVFFILSFGNATYGIAHGHPGIFVTNYRVVEAPGRKKVAREVHRTNSYASGVAYIYRIKTSQANRNKAVQRAYSYIGRGYNDNVVSRNKNDWGGLNCAQLVWAAYMYGSNIDITPNTTFISPYFLYLSPIPSLYDTINP